MCAVDEEELSTAEVGGLCVCVCVCVCVCMRVCSRAMITVCKQTDTLIHTHSLLPHRKTHLYISTDSLSLSLSVCTYLCSHKRETDMVTRKRSGVFFDILGTLEDDHLPFVRLGFDLWVCVGVCGCG